MNITKEMLEAYTHFVKMGYHRRGINGESVSLCEFITNIYTKEGE